MDTCEYAPYAAQYGACRGPVAPRDAIHVPDKPPVPCAHLCDKHAVNLRTGFHGDLDHRELACERRGQGACEGRVEYRDEIQTEDDCFPICLLCDGHWDRQLEEYVAAVGAVCSPLRHAPQITTPHTCGEAPPAPGSAQRASGRPRDCAGRRLTDRLQPDAKGVRRRGDR